MDKEQAIGIVKDYKAAIADLFDSARVYLYGSYSKGTAHPESDIDVAVIVPELQGDWLKLSTRLWVIAPKINYLIEPVLMEENEPSPLYDDVMKTGIAV
ncbi:MAG: nucleotidyltransferase domain-containing protein [Bacteroidaceae bacterium]|nr:nucleotidyltransferase domain-containing protein [Bacteroidaceae bacterium]